VVSDGIIEQPAAADESCEPRRQFGAAGVAALAAQLIRADEPLTALFDAVTRHAGTAALADDATGLSVRW
jgi:hypothetical protein